MDTVIDQTAAVTVNGRRFPLTDASPHVNLLDFLRDRGLTGSKEGCAEGECGACSVMVARPPIDSDESASEWTAINACLVPAGSLDGQEVVTAEGLGSASELHPVQQEMAVRGGSQCGYCTPGFVCSMAAEYYRPSRIPAATVDGNGAADHEHGPNGFDLHALSGNLCRCTGYRPIRDAAYALGAPPAGDPLAERSRHPAPPAATTMIRTGAGEFLRPTSFGDVLDLLRDRPDARLVAGSTDWGVEVNLRGVRAPLVVAIDRLPELRQLRVTGDEIEIGAALTLTEIERRLDGRIPLLAKMFPQFASRLIRNAATIGGNLGTASPIGDSTPALLALESILVLSSAAGDRRVPLAEYFTGYRQSVRRTDELIRSIVVPLPLAPMVAFHKVAKRRFDDISGVAVAFALDVQDGSVQRAVIGLGGVAATPLRATATEGALIGRPWSAETVTAAATVLGAEGTPMDDHRASAAYRSATLGQALPRLFAQYPEGPAAEGTWS